MGRKFSLEFGRKGAEGLNEEHDEDLIDDTLAGDGSEIKKILDEIEDDFEDCKKENTEKPEEEKEVTFEDCLKNQ